MHSAKWKEMKTKLKSVFHFHSVDWSRKKKNLFMTIKKEILFYFKHCINIRFIDLRRKKICKPPTTYTLHKYNHLMNEWFLSYDRVYVISDTFTDTLGIVSIWREKLERSKNKIEYIVFCLFVYLLIEHLNLVHSFIKTLQNSPHNLWSICTNSCSLWPYNLFTRHFNVKMS